MAREQARLSDRRARTATPKGKTKDGKKRDALMLADGGNLYLQVTVGAENNIRRSWIFRYRRPGGPVRDMGLGSLNDITLAEARDVARECRKLLREGIDPIEHRDARIARNIAASTAVMTFDEAAEIYIRHHRAGWTNASHAREWPSSLARYASPVIGKMSVADITTAHISKILDPIWHTTPATAQRVRRRVESVLGWCTVKGYRKGDNPARWKDHLENTLPAPSKVRKVEHIAALPYDQMPQLLQELHSHEGMPSYVLQFLALTLVRVSDVINARHADIDLGKRVWVIPEFSKTHKEHKVPLSDAAIAVIEKARQQARDIGTAGEYVFTNEFSGQRLSKNTPNNLISRLGRKGQLTPHGFRSSFRTWAMEKTNYAWEVAELSLGHAVGTKVERAYARGDAFQKRVSIMGSWAQFLAKPQQPGKVIPIQSRGA